MLIRKPKTPDLPQIYSILTQWNKPPHIEKLFELIQEEISHKLDYALQYFVLEHKGEILGVGGISNLYGEWLEYATKQRVGSIRTLYLNNKDRGKGYGKALP